MTTIQKSCLNSFFAFLIVVSFFSFIFFLQPVFGQSDTPQQPTITFLSPVGGERWEIGKTYSIQWSQIGIDRIEIMSNISGIVSVIQSRTTDTSQQTLSYQWTVDFEQQNAPYENVRIEITGYQGGYLKYKATSNAFWVILNQDTLPDYVILDARTGISVNPSWPLEERQLTEDDYAAVKLVVKNIGAGKGTAGGWDFSIERFGKAIEYFPPLPALNPGNTSEPVYTLGSLAPGRYSILFTLDPYDKISEKNEVNNTFTKTFTVNPQSSSINTGNETVPVVNNSSPEQKLVGGDVVAREKANFRPVDVKLRDRLRGQIVLQVQSVGEAWYIDPKTGKRFYLKDGKTAFEALRKFGIGIKTKDLEKITIGSTDLPSVKPKAASALCRRLEGNIYLQVESKGEAWYIHNCKRYYMKDGDLAYQIMRFLSLGITNENLRKIAVGEFE